MSNNRNDLDKSEKRPTMIKSESSKLLHCWSYLQDTACHSLFRQINWLYGSADSGSNLLVRSCIKVCTELLSELLCLHMHLNSKKRRKEKILDLNIHKSTNSVQHNDKAVQAEKFVGCILNEWWSLRLIVPNIYLRLKKCVLVLGCNVLQINLKATLKYSYTKIKIRLCACSHQNYRYYSQLGDSVIIIIIITMTFIF